jgi:hypothetical protein
VADEEAAELDRLRRLLCIPKADVQQLHKQICGRLYTEASALPVNLIFFSSPPVTLMEHLYADAWSMREW